MQYPKRRLGWKYVELPNQIIMILGKAAAVSEGGCSVFMLIPKRVQVRRKI